MKTNIQYIDLFAGAGGLSEGFKRTGKYNSIAHVEMNKHACDTLKTRLAYYYLRENNSIESYYKYLKKEISRDELWTLIPDAILESVINAELSDDNILEFFAQIDDLVGLSETKRVDLVIGGPPCQAYSIMGRSVSLTGMKDDPRNYLYKLYVKFITRYSPKMFIFENVPGILTAGSGKILEDIIESFSKSGYKVKYQVLNAEDFGVLQNRKRVILIGWKKEFNFSYPVFKKKYFPNSSVKFILDDLAKLDINTEDNRYISKSNDYLVKSFIRDSDAPLTWHVSRYTNKRDRKIYAKAIELWDKSKVRLRYDSLPKNLVTHKNQKSFLDRFKVLASNLPSSHTMIAHIAKDGHYFIHPDIKQCRSISVREAARIQSFPDDYFFEGPRTAAFTQIGNAVPPLMAYYIAKKLEEYFINED
ncbi:DNA cytosine methyltransferase [Streptococcus sanguinis]|uniref:DNA cytosine methyltransferase n=1 Tax=Streptococcus sanguinis TaxID=1305 RepID=UPI000FB9703B|nr:DNA (cytosine-5-)-methyltransferase [Streptococcus sanguinis]MCC3173149.1 DNA (cytosine-5-)-methyltransferase family protein [Streptococcus sanguinis]RSI34467.1 Modification methylase HaeIII [Streptococcus sanguinis]